MAKIHAGLIAKKIRNRKGVLTTVYVRIGEDPRHKRTVKLRKLISRYNKITTLVNKDINEQSGEKSLAALGIKIMMHLGIRIGNPKSAEGYVSLKTKKLEKTFGLTTLTKDHIKVEHDKVTLEFVGKKQVAQKIEVTNKELVKQITWAMSQEGNTLIGVGQNEINKYIRNNIGREFSPKDFRGLRANLEALKKINEVKKTPPPTTKTEANEEIKEIATHVANVLGNTAGVAKRSYIDADILFEHLHSRYNPKRKSK